MSSIRAPPDKKVSASQQAQAHQMREMVAKDQEKILTTVDMVPPVDAQGNRFISGYTTESIGGPARGTPGSVIDQVSTAATDNLDKLVKFTKADKQWVEQESRKHVMQSLSNPNNPGVIPGVGRVEAGPAFFDYAQRQMEQELSDDLKKYKFSMIRANLHLPEQRAFWEKQFPELTKELMDGLRQRRIEEAKLEHIGLYGASTYKDFWLLFKRQQDARNEFNPLKPTDTPLPFGVPRNTLLGNVLTWWSSDSYRPANTFGYQPQIDGVRQDNFMQNV